MSLAKRGEGAHARNLWKGLGRNGLVWSLRVGGGNDSGPAESTRGWPYGTRENPRQRGLVNEGVRDSD
jgi:hypothetical protein